MNKIMCLIPCLMLENNRQRNKTSLNSLLTTYNFDQVTVYDQMFTEEDYDSRVTYIGHAKERMGWIISRNALLKYFYESDFDYAFWIDANATVSKSSSNDLLTLINAIHNNKIDDCDAIFSTLGIWISTDRRLTKQSPNYHTHVTLIPRKYDKNYCWLHGMFMKNFKKYYNEEPYIDERADTYKGTAEDVFFSRLIRKVYSTWLCPTIVINKPSSKASTAWANDSGTYNYPKDDYETVDRYIEETITRYNLEGHKIPQNIIEILRLDENKELLKDFVPRPKKEKQSNKTSLFTL